MSPDIWSSLQTVTKKRDYGQADCGRGQYRSFLCPLYICRNHINADYSVFWWLDQTYSDLGGDKCCCRAQINRRWCLASVRLQAHQYHRRGIFQQKDRARDRRPSRMYVASSNMCDVIVRWHKLPSLGTPVTRRTCTNLGPEFDDNPRLSLREPLIHAVLSSLDRKDIEMRDVAADAYPATEYLTQSSKKRQRRPFRLADKAGSTANCPHDRFNSLVLQLQLLPDQTSSPTCGRAIQVSKTRLTKCK